MSEENVEIVRQTWEAFVGRDNEAAFRFYDPEVEINSAREGASIGAWTVFESTSVIG
jgi:hypothetical protein